MLQNVIGQDNKQKNKNKRHTYWKIRVILFLNNVIIFMENYYTQLKIH